MNLNLIGNDMLLEIFALVSVLCLAYYIYDNWNDGHDLEIGTLLSMLLVALIPVLNVLVCVHLWMTWNFDEVSVSSVILKGRKK